MIEGQSELEETFEAFGVSKVSIREIEASLQPDLAWVQISKEMKEER